MSTEIDNLNFAEIKNVERIQDAILEAIGNAGGFDDNDDRHVLAALGMVVGGVAVISGHIDRSLTAVLQTARAFIVDVDSMID